MNIGINIDRFMILDKDLKLLREFSYDSLLKWGFSAKLFILLISKKEEDHVESALNHIKISFSTRMSADIVHILNSFINIKMGKEPQPN